ncbi:MAG: hypothetical protein GY909_14370 [Oligoflexia bacterium]|nr:hypothetical protein [Oligoflexia bacterium]
MKFIKIIFFLFFATNVAHAKFQKIEVLAPEITEAQRLVEIKNKLHQIRKERRKGIKTDEKAKAFEQSTLKIADELELIAKNGCECQFIKDENAIKSQALTMAAAIYGILAKDTNSVFLGKKSFKALEKARELDPENLDALKGQAIALNMILKKNWALQKIVSLAIGVNLKDACKELVDLLRDHPERKDLQDLANQLEKNL